MKHTPEPWQVMSPGTPKKFIVSTGYDWIAECEEQVNADRIVACVNAMEGKSDPAEYVKRATELANLYNEQVLEIEELKRERNKLIQENNKLRKNLSPSCGALYCVETAGYFNIFDEPFYDGNNVLDADQVGYEKAKQYSDILVMLYNQFTPDHITGRISESVYQECKTVDELITKMGTTKDGYKISGVGEPKEFLQRLESFKQFLERELPQFSIIELLKIDKYFSQLRKMYEWYGFEYYMQVLEYQFRKQKEGDSESK